MHVTTFYSFKGGVGRTMALVNVATELVRRGRRVLVVDFDLEAPGLETYEHLRPPKAHPGIVEYVTEYRRSPEVPNFLDYLYETQPIGKKGGRMWVMPAGRRDHAYRSALAKLDWQRLYKDEEGFLLFEDTKKGWEQELKPDYVFIDSRTGDTDVLGICTRQLPDSVVIMFTPNEQNLAGLESVCWDIRDEKTSGLKKDIMLHFVAANVPDLDDERGILRSQIEGFKKRLNVEKFEYWGEIRRYEDLGLLDQSIFTLDRPRTRLAHAYRRLLRTLRKDNLADRDGAIRFLEQYLRARISDPLDEHYISRLLRRRESFKPGSRGDPLNPLDHIADIFPQDAGVRTLIAECRCKDLDAEKAEKDLTYVLVCGSLPGAESARLRFERGNCRMQLQKRDEAVADFRDCLRTPGLQDRFIVTVFKELRNVSREGFLEAIRDPAFGNLTPDMQASIAAHFLGKIEEELPLALEILRKNRGLTQSGRLTVDCSFEIRELLLRMGRWKEFLEEMDADEDSQKNAWFQLGRGLHHLLGVAFAHWAIRGRPSPEDFIRLSHLREECSYNFDDDMVAWIQWGAGNKTAALQFLGKAEKWAKEVGADGEIFSCWRFQFVSTSKYVEDCKLVRRMFMGEPLRPAFLGEVRHERPA